MIDVLRVGWIGSGLLFLATLLTLSPGLFALFFVYTAFVMLLSVMLLHQE